jgi:hypothetical protein
LRTNGGMKLANFGNKPARGGQACLVQKFREARALIERTAFVSTCLCESVANKPVSSLPLAQRVVKFAVYRPASSFMY